MSKTAEPASRTSYEQFLKLFTRDQLRVFGYILALVHNRNDAQDIFQETSLVLWREFETYDPDRPFLPWALGVARNQVLKFWRSRKRDQHVFSDGLAETLAAEAATTAAERVDRSEALQSCVQKLPERQRQLIDWFYGQNLAAGDIAQRWDRSVHAVYKALKVMRRNLMQCVEQKLKGC